MDKNKIKRIISLLVLVVLISGCATTSPKQSNGTGYPQFVTASSPFGFGGPDKEGNIHDTGWVIKLLSLLAGSGLPQTSQTSGSNLSNGSSGSVRGVSLAPDGTYVTGRPTLAPNGKYVGGKPTLAPDGTYVAGNPQLAPDGTYVGGRPRLAPDGSYVGGNPILAPNGGYVGDGS